MIAIQNPSQFQRAADRLRNEPQAIRRHEPGLFMVNNKKKGTAYSVRIERRDGLTFGTCACEAGTPTNRRSAPMVCKHLAAVVIFLRAVRAMRLHAGN